MNVIRPASLNIAGQVTSGLGIFARSEGQLVTSIMSGTRHFPESTTPQGLKSTKINAAIKTQESSPATPGGTRTSTSGQAPDGLTIDAAYPENPVIQGPML
jgi:hypothetical protein